MVFVAAVVMSHSPAFIPLVVIVNGEERLLSPSILTIAALIEELGLTGQRIAVEADGQLIPRSRHASTSLTSGMRLEIVHAVGGG